MYALLPDQNWRIVIQSHAIKLDMPPAHLCRMPISWKPKSKGLDCPQLAARQAQVTCLRDETTKHRLILCPKGDKMSHQKSLMSLLKPYENRVCQFFNFDDSLPHLAAKEPKHKLHSLVMHAKQLR